MVTGGEAGLELLSFHHEKHVHGIVKGGNEDCPRKAHDVLESRGELYDLALIFIAVQIQFQA